MAETPKTTTAKPAVATPPPKPKEIAPIDAIRTSLTKMEDQFKMALPPQISPERFVRNAMTAIQKNPDLLAADRQSLFSATMESAQDGLLLDGKEATLVIFNSNAGTDAAPKWVKTVKYMPMVYGILKKVRNSGQLASIASEVVYQNDGFKFWVDDNGSHLEHHPKVFGERGEKIGVYALAKTKDGEVYIEVMDKAQVLAVKGKSKAQNSLMWTTFDTEGWRKVFVRRLSKRLPMSTDVEAVIQRDDALYDLDDPEKSPEKLTATTSARLSKIVKGGAAPVDAVIVPQPNTAVPAEEEPPPEETETLI